MINSEAIDQAIADGACIDPYAISRIIWNRTSAEEPVLNYLLAFFGPYYGNVFLLRAEPGSTVSIANVCHLLQLWCDHARSVHNYRFPPHRDFLVTFNNVLREVLQTAVQYTFEEDYPLEIVHHTRNVQFHD